MKPFYRVLAVGVFTLAAFVLAPAAFATSGTLMITSSTTLTEDHYGSIYIVADNVTLDGDGYTVYGPSASGFNGLINVAYTSGVTVKDVTVTGSQVNGLYAEGGSNLRLEGNTFIGNANHGVHIDSMVGGDIVSNTSRSNQALGFVWTRSIDAWIADNTAMESGWGGFALFDGSGGSTLVGNTAKGNGQGFIFDHSNGNTAIANTAQQNTERGFLIVDASRTVLTNNTSNRNGFEGFLLSAAEDSIITGNTANENGDPDQLVYAGFALLNGSSGNQLNSNAANGNGDVGFVIEASSENTLARNVANANGRIGFEVRSGSSFNVIHQNVARNNPVVDASDDQTGTGNSWTSNKFGTTSGI